jgi:hypothetical protein
MKQFYYPDEQTVTESNPNDLTAPEPTTAAPEATQPADSEFKPIELEPEPNAAAEDEDPVEPPPEFDDEDLSVPSLDWVNLDDVEIEPEEETQEGDAGKVEYDAKAEESVPEKTDEESTTVISR